MSAKPHLNLIVMGHVDHGKSTLTGHLLFDAGYIDQKTIDQYAKESEKTGAGETFKFAWSWTPSRRSGREELRSTYRSKSLRQQRTSSPSSMRPGTGTSSRT